MVLAFEAPGCPLLGRGCACTLCMVFKLESQADWLSPKGSLPPGRLASPVTPGVMREVEKIPDPEPKPGAVSTAPGDTNRVVHHLGPG